jgi:hypothetical protein
MDDQAFQPDTPEQVLHEQATVLMAGGPFTNKRGNAFLTNDRILFADVKFDPGEIGGALAGWLESFRKDRPPMVDMPLADVTKVWHLKKLTVRDIIVVESSSGEARFSTGFKEWTPLLRRAITERHGRTVTDDGEEGFSVS